MKKLNLILGGTDRRLNSRIEAAALDVCYGVASVGFTRAARLSELIQQGSYVGYDLMVLSPKNLLPEPSCEDSWVPLEEVAKMLRHTRSQRSMPIIAVGVSARDEAVLAEAGADSVLRSPFNGEEFKTEFRRVMALPELVAGAEPVQMSLLAALVRGWRRLKNA